MNLREQYEKKTGCRWENAQGEPDLDYVEWLETAYVDAEENAYAMAVFVFRKAKTCGRYCVDCEFYKPENKGKK
jgi:hypothetical protein